MSIAASKQFERYGLNWTEGTDAFQIESFMIRKGGRWTGKSGQTIGRGLAFHYGQLWRALWPDDDVHRWSELAVENIVNNPICVLMGPGDSNKTYSAAKYILSDYWVFPDDTCSLVSSTDIRGLELRVWGTIKDLFNRGRDLFPYLAGHCLESIHAITTDEIDDEEARVLKKGIICIPCLQGGKFVGLGKYVGIKQRRVRLAADECQLMGPSFLNSLSNLSGNPDFKGVFMGNPLDMLDPLGQIAEPEGGWDESKEPEKTTVWKTRFPGGVCVNFVGTDSPNFDYPQDQPVRFPYMINRRKIAQVASFWGQDSLQYYSQCKGVMKAGLLARRVITRALCLEHRARDVVFWKGESRTLIFALDAAYSGTGGDRCVGGHIEFGEDIDGVVLINVHAPQIVPVSLRLKKSPEDQIADWCLNYMTIHRIPTQNGFYDSTGRGTLGSALARVFGAVTPIPVEFGGRASPRPVRHDLFIEEGPPNRRIKRLKRCDEHYSKFVTELWFSARYVVECDQMRGLPEDVMQEGCMREYGIAAGNRIEVETKDDTKERMGHSPDLFDWLVTAVEGARQRGFKIQRLGAELIEKLNPNLALEELRKKVSSLHKSKRLIYK